MDINFPLPKDQGCFECVDIIDRISKLPDEILAKILSCLSTKESVATSILSIRWEHLWTLTSDLDFSAHWLDEYKAEDTNENSCMIPELSLSLNRLESQSRTYLQLPRRLYSCDTLVALRICGDFVIDLPTFVCFPCLKLLKIAYVVFVDDASMERLLSSCPVLEELTVVSLKHCLEIMNISVPSLKRLYILANKIPTKINTPCLEYLEIIHRPEDPPSRYFVNFTSSLVHAKLHGLEFSLLNAVSQVENLVLTANDESLQNIVRDSALPIFENLKTLKLLFACSTPMDKEVLANLLHSSPNLQALIFPEGLVHFAFCGDFLLPSWQWSEFVPECLSTHLKTIEIFEFVGFPWEIELVGYLLKSAKVLEKMIIHKFVLSKHPTIKKKLSKNLSEVWSLLSNCSSSAIMRSGSCSSSCEIVFTD